MTSEWSRSDPAFLAAYGDAVRHRRDAMKMDRRALAERAEVSYSYLSAIESGERFPSAKVQAALAEALEVEPSELLTVANTVVERSILASDAEMTPGPRSPALRSSLSMASMRPVGERRQSAAGASTELDALVARMSGEDRVMLLNMARRLAAASGPAPQEWMTTPQSEWPAQAVEASHRGRGGREMRTRSFLDFWTLYHAELDKRGLDWAAGRRPEPRSYFTTPSPIRGASLSASFARNHELRHELYINRGSRDANLELLHQLERLRKQFEAAYGRQLDFEDPGRERRAARVAEYRPGHISDASDYDDFVDWFIDRGERMRRALMVIDAT